MKKNNIIVALLAVAALAGNSALAATTTGTMQVNTSVASSCAVTTENIVFGPLDSSTMSSGVSTTSRFSVTCTKSTPYSVELNPGSSGSYAMRTMGGAKTGNADKLRYNIYTQADYAVANIFGNGASGTRVLQNTGTGQVITNTIFSKVEPGQYLTPDSYSDSLIIAVVY